MSGTRRGLGLSLSWNVEDNRQVNSYLTNIFPARAIFWEKFPFFQEQTFVQIKINSTITHEKRGTSVEQNRIQLNLPEALSKITRTDRAWQAVEWISLILL